MKNPIFRGRCIKNQYIGGEWPTKGGLGQFADLRRGLAKKRVIFWEGVETLMHTMSSGSLIDTVAYRHKISKANNIA